MKSRQRGADRYMFPRKGVKGYFLHRCRGAKTADKNARKQAAVATDRGTDRHTGKLTGPGFSVVASNDHTLPWNQHVGRETAKKKQTPQQENASLKDKNKKSKLWSSCTGGQKKAPA